MKANDGVPIGSGEEVTAAKNAFLCATFVSSVPPWWVFLAIIHHRDTEYTALPMLQKYPKIRSTKVHETNTNAFRAGSSPFVDRPFLLEKQELARYYTEIAQRFKLRIDLRKT